MSCAGSLKIVAPPTAFMSTADAKLFLRVDDNGEDALIDSLVMASVSRIEEYLNRKLLTQTWAYFLDNFPYANSNQWWDGVRDGAVTELYGPADHIKIPIGPIQSVTHLKTYSSDGTPSTFASGNYTVYTVSPHGRIALNLGQIWPSTILRPVNGIEIQFVCGYGAVGDVPRPIQQAIRELLAAMYERRGDEVLKLPMTAIAMCQPYRVNNL